MLNGKKIGGILLESATATKSGKKPLVVGFGLNLLSSPALKSLDEDALPATSLKTGGTVLLAPTKVLDALMTTYKKWDDLFFQSGFSNITKAFLERTVPIGQRIKVKMINKASCGSFSGISDNGSLILETKTGIIFITAGDVTLVGN